ncbi:MAG: helix-turn-helix transcriptional regulator [Magnetococcales bacterium]|nr:helix-turn-helix transcriptional regulator [Magnetococcales bacterium]
MQIKKSPPILARVEDYLKNNENQFVADKIGVAPQTVSSWKKRGDMPAASAIEFAERESLSLDWLLAGRGPMRWSTVNRDLVVMSEDEISSTGEFALVPRYDVRASAGHGMVIDAENILDHMAFRMDWLRGVMNLQVSQLALIHVDGDSMEPTLRPGEMILVDMRLDSRRIGSALYVIQSDGVLQVKRLTLLIDGSVVIKSDNPGYQAETIPPEKRDLLHVVGRVVWAGRRM